MAMNFLKQIAASLLASCLTPTKLKAAPFGFSCGRASAFRYYSFKGPIGRQI